MTTWCKKQETLSVKEDIKKAEDDQRNQRNESEAWQISPVNILTPATVKDSFFQQVGEALARIARDPLRKPQPDGYVKPNTQCPWPECAPPTWQGRTDLWVHWTSYKPAYDWSQSSSSKGMRVSHVVKRQERTPITTLQPSDHGTAYRQLHRVATPAQMEEYYRLHRDQLDHMRLCIAYEELEHWKNLRKIRHAKPTSYCHVFNSSKTTAPLSDYEIMLRQHYGARAKCRKWARGLEQLMEECEDRLRQQDENFTAIDWRPFTSRKRWADGRKGWTGLSADDVHSDAVEAREKDPNPVWIPSEVGNARLKARFARWFPRAADQRNRAADEEMGN